jgi:hypothetical protein
MKPRIAAKIFLLLTLLLPAYAYATGLGELRLSRIEGDVQIRTADTPEWSPAAINFPLMDGDQLWVPEGGRAEVESRRGSIIRLDERTALDILAVDNDALQFYLAMGLAYANSRGERGTTLQMDTPLSSIRVYERAKFSVDVSSDNDTDISVFLGAIAVESRKGEAMVEAGNMLSLQEYRAYLSPLGRADAWERWNKDQDKAIEGQRMSARYLPEELTGYSSDFDNNGEWVDLPSYGYVWRPRIQVGTDWSPYRYGRWVWIGDDYVWISHESWGWAPYHYGRWFFVPRHGWCWVPPARHEAYWGPGYVGWVQTPTYVAWVPLAPKEIYYGHGYYGSNSVDLRKVDANRIVVKTVYKNAYVKNSVTTVPNDTFIRGRQVDFKVDGNPFLKEKISVGRPRIQPERATRIPSIREIPRAKAPPDKIKMTSVEELRKHRRLVKQRDKSVFVPESKPRAMTVEKEKEPKARVPRNNRVTAGESHKTAPQKREDAQPAPVARKSPPESHTPPPESRQESRQTPKPEAKDKESTSNRSQTNQRSIQQPAAPREDSQPAPAARKSPPQPSAPPPESRQESRQSPQPGARDKESTSNRSQTKRQANQPPVSKEEARTTPDVPKEGTKDKGPTLTPAHKKKVKKEKPADTEEVPPDQEESEE